MSAPVVLDVSALAAWARADLPALAVGELVAEALDNDAAVVVPPCAVLDAYDAVSGDHLAAARLDKILVDASYVVPALTREYAIEVRDLLRAYPGMLVGTAQSCVLTSALEADLATYEPDLPRQAVSDPRWVNDLGDDGMSPGEFTVG